VWIDMVEPEDEAWDERARRRYAQRPVYIVGGPADGARWGAREVWGTGYARLFRLPGPVADPQ
jgi:hypothetical protein